MHDSAASVLEQLTLQDHVSYEEINTLWYDAFHPYLLYRHLKCVPQHFIDRIEEKEDSKQ